MSENPQANVQKVAAGLKKASKWFQNMVCINKYTYVDATPDNSKQMLTPLNNLSIRVKKGGI